MYVLIQFARIASIVYAFRDANSPPERSRRLEPALPRPWMARIRRRCLSRGLAGQLQSAADREHKYIVRALDVVGFVGRNRSRTCSSDIVKEAHLQHPRPPSMEARL